MARVFIILTFVVVVFGRRRKHTLSRQKKATVGRFSKPTVKQTSNLISSTVTIAEQVLEG